MTLPEDDVARVQAWCVDRVPAHARDDLRIDCEIGERELVIVERHPPLVVSGGPVWTRQPVARLRRAGFLWSLRWYHGEFRRCEWLQPTTDIGELLDELDRDPTGLFWG